MSVTSHATVLLVDDVGRALDYYRDQLGFAGHAWEVNPRHYGYASRGGCHVHFACFRDAGPRPNSETVPSERSGKVSRGVKVTHVFVLKNVGGSDLSVDAKPG